jgi:hypothetical protein
VRTGCAALLSTRAVDRSAGSASNLWSKKSVPPWPTAARASGAASPPRSGAGWEYRFRQGDRLFMISTNGWYRQMLTTSGKSRCPKQGLDRRSNHPQRHRGGWTATQLPRLRSADRLRDNPQVADKRANHLQTKRVSEKLPHKNSCVDVYANARNVHPVGRAEVRGRCHRLCRLEERRQCVRVPRKQDAP